MVLEDRSLHSLEDRSLHSLEDRFASAALEDRSLTLTRRTSRHSVPIFKGFARSSNKVIFKGSARSSSRRRLEQPQAIFNR